MTNVTSNPHSTTVRITYQFAHKTLLKLIFAALCKQCSQDACSDNSTILCTSLAGLTNMTETLWNYFACV